MGTGYEIANFVDLCCTANLRASPPPPGDGDDAPVSPVIAKACAFVFLKIANRAILLAPPLQPAGASHAEAVLLRRAPAPSAPPPPPRRRIAQAAYPRAADGGRFGRPSRACRRPHAAPRAADHRQRAVERDAVPPAGFVALQIGRLSDAMRSRHARMMEGDLEAMDRAIRVISELDGYHGFAPAEAAPAPASAGAVNTPAR